MSKKYVTHTYTHTHTHTHTHTGIYYSAIKINEKFPFSVTWMEPEGIMFSEKSQKKKKKVYLISYMWNLNNEIGI